jgi:ferredoxin-NADP reductase
MARTAPLGRLTWQAAEVVAANQESPRVRSLTLAVPGWRRHRPGQHVDLRLTAEDGYEAVRSYSIASPPEAVDIVLTIERLEDGEVSPYLVDDVLPGDLIEVRGPIGGYFVWEANGSLSDPLQLLGGGSGVIPLMAMLRHRAAAADETPARLLYSARAPEDVIYASELAMLAAENHDLDIQLTYTRAAPPGWDGYRRRIDADMLAEVAWPAASGARAYICGPTRFVETAAAALLELGYAPERVRTERFGPTGA